MSTRRMGDVALLLAILLAATGLRFWGAAQVGIRLDDEAAYAHDARLWHRCMRLTLDPQALGGLIRGDKGTVKERMAALGIDFGARYLKPSQGYTMLAGAAMFLTGDDPATLNLLNAACGVLSVYLLYLIAGWWCGRRVGLLAALFLAVSPYHLVYARSALVVAPSLALILVSIWSWTAAQRASVEGDVARAKRWYLASGAALGWAITCHYSNAFVLGVLFVAEWMAGRHWSLGGPASAPCVDAGSTDTAVRPDRFLIQAVDQGASRSTQGGDCPTRRARSSLSYPGVVMRLTAGVLIAPLLIEGVFRILALAARLAGGELPFPSFLEAYAAWSKIVATCGVQSSDALLFDWRMMGRFLGYLVHWDGWPVGLLAGLGGVVTRLRYPRARVAILVPAVLLIILSLQRYPVARAFGAAIPFVCLLAAVGAGWIIHRLHRRRGMTWAGVFLMGIMLAPQLPNVRLLLLQQSGLPRACAFLNERGWRVELPAETTARSKYALYLDPQRVDARSRRLYRLGAPRDVLQQLRDEGVHWIVTDPQVWHMRDLDRRPDDIIYRWWREFEQLVAAQGPPVYTVSHLESFRWAFLSEGPGEALLDEMKAAGAGPIRIYALTPCSSNIEVTANAQRLRGE